MSILINPFNWGEAQVVDLQKVLESVVYVMDLYFESKIESDIVVKHDPIEGPMVLDARGENGEYQVLLSSKNLFWAQHSYQFAHEYCHIRTNYISGNPKTKWFEETICELASLFALRRMSEVWQVSAPYEHWRDYSSALYKYAENRISDDKYKLLEGIEFLDWFRASLADLERDQYMREANTRIAIKLLPIFEANPRLWLALSYFNKWDASEIDDIYQCFDNWLSIIPMELKPMVSRLAGVFGSKT
ncbi:MULTISPECIES: hypothetical protein [unclassified Vibrio]|uniref:hypothetical protein n=1 Tax=unclassified Vibrio TaxID=2614977 RepID=UPI001360C864|nr:MULTISPECIES: hypothetical protein [unclassified Vibrio]NAW56348.1 hypothetical protein [Vibrio sp. V36_P2S2PM302]NAX25538.1 hypothetical protein [Vibrio sp. V38_P2S17PM301]NAX30413.1 hypothetical protein [Vibrio sp. V37_P2S8PM304]